VKCVTFVSETFTWYSSNKTNACQEIRVLWNSFEKFCTQNYENPFIFAKLVTKSVAHFLNFDTVYITVSHDYHDNCLHLSSWTWTYTRQTNVPILSLKINSL